MSLPRELRPMPSPQAGARLPSPAHVMPHAVFAPVGVHLLPGLVLRAQPVGALALLAGKWRRR